MRWSVAPQLNREFTFRCDEKGLEFVFHIFRLRALGQLSLWKPLSLEIATSNVSGAGGFPIE